jgi:hypothetical protein
MSGGGSVQKLTVRCACGWEWAGDVEAVVAATQDHETRIHHVEATREEVLAMAVDDDAPTAAPTANGEPPPAG